MTSPVVTVAPDTALSDALALMRERRIRRLPVQDGGALVGIVTWTDLMRALPSPDAPLEEAATMMRDYKIGALPVVAGDALVGIITESDVFDAFITLLGARLPSYRITLDVDDGPSALPDITAAVRMLGLRLHSMASYPAARGRRRVVLRVERTLPIASVVDGLKEHGLAVVHAAADGTTLAEAVARYEPGSPQ